MKLLKELRESKGLTQKELSELLNYPQTTISGWEKGEVEYDKSLIKVAQFFNVSVGYLLGVEDSEGVIHYTENELSVADKKFLHDFYSMPPEKQDFVREIVESASKNRDQ